MHKLSGVQAGHFEYLESRGAIGRGSAASNYLIGVKRLHAGSTTGSLLGASAAREISSALKRVKITPTAFEG